METQEIINILAANYPPAIGFVPPLVLLLLGVLSLIDAITGRVPDVLSVGGFIGAFCALAYAGGWLVAGEHFAYAAAAVLALRLMNRLYLKISKHDAFGFGDAKWTGLAVIAYGLPAVAWAWVVAAWIAIVWMAVRKAWQRFSDTYQGHAYVHFAPFLFAGLIVSLFLIMPRM